MVDLYDYLGIVRDKQTDLLGALFIEESTIRLHSGIDPEDYPWLEGRSNFTLAHEVAHWVLHRDEYQTHARQGSLFEDLRPQQIICRRSEKTERIDVDRLLEAAPGPGLKYKAALSRGLRCRASRWRGGDAAHRRYRQQAHADPRRDGQGA